MKRSALVRKREASIVVEVCVDTVKPKVNLLQVGWLI